VPTPDWQDFRRNMPVTRDWAYFDHAAVSPLPEPARALLAQWAQDVADSGDAHWPQWAERLERVRRLGADLIGAESSEVALIRNTTEGVNLVAEGFPWQPGDNVVTLADEFPSNLYPWMNLRSRGVEARLVPTDNGRVDLDRLEAACDHRTRLISVSWVGYASGWRNDLDAVAELAHSRQAYFFLDAIQGLGVFPLDVRKTKIDFLSADGHKWLLGPEGAGLFYLRREHLDLLRPLGVGWNSVAQAQNFSRVELTLKDSAARYEGGTYNMGGLIALGASLELLAAYGSAAISRRVLEITDDACRRLSEFGAVVSSCREPGHASGIVGFELPGREPVAVRKQCLQQKVVLSCRAGRLRISPHAYNNAEDLDRLLAALEP
jgi:cysteine desulfurase/selenocysteine lyase